ncbi:MAG: hypothetical protein HUU14_06570, partial [Dehalococcoidia bacterium]|nr:hypothetical protein [Dehalococcoidia bacterium]
MATLPVPSTCLRGGDTTMRQAERRARTIGALLDAAEGSFARSGYEGASLDAMRAGLEAFEGVERRFQRLGSVRGVQVVDDYAHHPTEILATLEAARAAFPGRRLLVAFQPHLYSRTRDFAEAFGRALVRADVAFLTEIYPAREQPLAGVTAGLVEDAMSRAGRRPVWRGERGLLAAAIAERAA